MGMTGVRLDRLVDRELRVLINLGDTSDPYFTYKFINCKDLSHSTIFFKTHQFVGTALIMRMMKRCV